MNPGKIYPRSQGRETIYLKAAITRPDILVGDYTIYNVFCGRMDILPFGIRRRN